MHFTLSMELSEILTVFMITSSRKFRLFLECTACKSVNNSFVRRISTKFILPFCLLKVKVKAYKIQRKQKNNLAEKKEGRQLKGKVALHNLGCKVNAYETEAMQQMLEAAGYEIVPFEPGADIYVINTCSVTNIADRSRDRCFTSKK